MNENNDFLSKENCRREIEHIRTHLGWTISDFAGRYLIDTTEYDVEAHEIKTNYEKMRKQLGRSSTSTALLRPYLIFLKETQEYKKLKMSDKFNELELLTGLFADHQIILREESDPVITKVLEVAAAYALSIGGAWNFKVVSLGLDKCGYDNRFVVIWTGTVGHGGGSGSWGTAMCEVVESYFGGVYFVENTTPHFDTSLRDITDIVGYLNNELILIGYTYADDDVGNFPTLKYRVTLVKENRGDEQWKVTNRNFLERNYLFSA